MEKSDDEPGDPAAPQSSSDLTAGLLRDLAKSARVSQPPLAAGTRLGPYLIEGVLGEGGMGRVYRARDSRLKRHVALKVISSPTDGPASGDAEARFLREAQAAAALDHPNAIAIHDLGQAGGVSYIAMELVAGHTLRRYIGAAEPAWPERVRWLIEVASALGAAHRAGLVHRDVKPENVMLRDDGRIKVLDFGIARRLDTDLDPAGPTATLGPSVAPLTREGGLIGTPLYMAPEQLRGEVVDGRADQFAWSVMAYELLAGRQPWTTLGIAARVEAIATSEPAPMPKEAGVPAAVEAVVRKALRRSPGDRFALMDEVARELAAATTGPAEGGAGAALGREGRPKRARWIGGVVVAVLVAAGFAGQRAWPRGSAAPTPSLTALAPTAVAMTDRPAPASTSPEAQRVYAAALLESRNGSLGPAIRGFQRAVDLDPSMGAGWIRIAVCTWNTFEWAELRDALRRAIQHRSSLDAQDQVFLHALEPLLQVPHDYAELTRRLEQAALQFPRDAEIASAYANAVWSVNWDLDATLRLLERASELDPKNAHTLGLIGWAQAYLGRDDDARATLDRAVAISPTGTIPWWFRIMLHEQHGDCSRFEVDARTFVAIRADDPDSYQSLAEALASLGRPVEAIEAVLRQGSARAPEGDRRRTELLDSLRLDLLQGDFASASLRAMDLDREVAREPSKDAHAPATAFLVEAYQETGELAKAAGAAEGYLRRAEAWSRYPVGDDATAAFDITSILLDTLYRAGKLGKTELAKRREVFLQQWAKRADGEYAGRYIWFYAWAAPARTPEEANEALAAALHYSPLPVFRPRSLATGAEGKVRFLAGQLDTAIPLLKRACATCRALADPVKHTRLHATLGQALEQTGDRAGACAAYKVVLDRWGHAKPRSVTADAVKVRVKALGCASP